MQAFPHHYVISATAEPDGEVALTARLFHDSRHSRLEEFDGPGGRWSPETLAVAAVADCFVLTFRGIAKAARLPWLALNCEAAGTLDRVAHLTRFTRFDLQASVDVSDGVSDEQVRRVVARAEHTCLIANSLNARVMSTRKSTSCRTRHDLSVGHHHGGAFDPALAGSRERFVRVRQGIRNRSCLNRNARCRLQELLGVGAREIGDRTNGSFPQRSAYGMAGMSLM